ncbi:Ig-like domain-containing protein [Treponema sp. Marseille-Q3903]|uniref:Ig-like domain-containing protein n=1 Tax=Treponema sp. Marseille-Q3903 TaxID=2766703 RepID=UPI0016528A37|nr:Ig-like domain-containing protein [Treponema sp. Marseille-Q3903]MBC6713603.1 Ig-like domain-containing protein [Treponema sp. Marseille-Q3903]
MKNFKFTKTVILFLSIVCFLSSCNFFNSFSEDQPGSSISITSLTMAKTSVNVSVGEMNYVTVNIRPNDVQKDVKLAWSYDESIIKADTSSAWGVTITGKKEGQTNLKCSYGGYEATCIVTVKGFAKNYEETVEPYIYSSTSIIQTAPGVTEKVFCSLYGGSAADIDGYSWTCDNPNVASIEPTGQYCLITAKDTGYARVKITHNKASYPYYMGIYVFADATNVTYITTTNNILTMNLADNEQNISVSLVNGKKDSSDSQFRWEIINEDSNTPVRVETNGNKAVVKPLKAGSCTLRVTHPDSAYPLDILCRVISVVKNVYIQPDKTVVTLSGETEQTVKSTLENINIGEYDVDGFTYALDDYNVAEIVGWVGNEVMLKGKANGSCKLLISHEKAAYTREVLLIVNGQLTDAVDSSCYITTSQNYVRTKVGAEGTYLNVSLKGGSEGDEAGFTWSIKSTTTDGSSNDVVSMDTSNGSVIHSRAASFTYAYGKAFIEPKYEGTAVITITHPKVIYPTEILVKVLNRDAILTEPLYFAGDGLIRVLNGATTEYTVQLKGNNKVASDDGSIRWSCNNPAIGISANGNVANITAPPLGTGNTISYITISHNKADADKKVMILTADTEKELRNMKALYSDKLYYNLEIGKSAYCMTSQVGFESYETKIDENGKEYQDEKPYDFSAAQWTVTDSTVCSVEKIEANPLTASVKGLKAGTATVTVTVKDSENKSYSCSYTITVYPERAVQTLPEVYFTTSQNVVNLGKAGDEKQVSVSAINLSSSKYGEITWTVEDESVARVSPNGTSATITAKKEGETIVRVTHTDSQNTLKIYVRVGSEYVINEAEPVVYISSSDVITMLKDDPAQRLDAVLVNYTGPDKTGFNFEIDKPEIAQISSQSTNGLAYIKPVGSGQAEITITHTKSTISKKVLVVVGNSAEDLAGFTYLTTSSNVVAIGEGNTRTVSVSVKNSEEVIVDGYNWVSSDPSIVDITQTGATAVLKGNSIGTAIITVTNRKCAYSLQIIAQCVDPIAAAANPYIQLTSSVITVNIGSTYTSVTADLVGGKEGDLKDFIWQSNDSSICVCYGQNEVGKIRALKEGIAYITVSHPKSVYSAQILVVCDKVVQSDCYISVPSSIINMKPTDSTQTITASLVNGSETDKYNFTWSLDVYDVINFVYSANVCTIEPKQQGQVTITIHHPKATYDQQIVVTVQEYSTFKFPDEYTSITAGRVDFKTMEVPNTKVSTHVEYSTDNPNICLIEGTKTTAQIKGIAAGTTTVHARLVANSTGVVQASAEMMVYVKEAEVNACYITSSSTIYTVNKGKSQTLSASITGTGIVSSDQQNLKWTTSDTDIVSIAGLTSNGTVTGQSIYITANKSGEAIITCSHEKAASNLQFFVVVPGSAVKAVTFNKSYITLLKGSSGTTLKATIENAESNNDYNDLEWTVHNVGENEVCRVMGSGQNVTIYPINVGEAEVMAQLPDSNSVAKCTVLVQAGKSFVLESTSASVQPNGGTKKIKYTVSPATANITWTMNQQKDFFTYTDLGCDANGVGYVQVEGIAEGSGNLYGVTDGNVKVNLSVRVAWDYDFTLTGKFPIKCIPTESAEIGFKVNPKYADIAVTSADDGYYDYVVNNSGDGTGTIIITPKSETPQEITIHVQATNPNNNNEVVGSKTFTAKFAYADTDIKPILSFTNKDGIFSRFDRENNVLYIGDGETGEFYTTMNLPVANARIENITFTPKSGVTVSGFNTSTSTFTVNGGTDNVDQVYYVSSAKKPVYYPNLERVVTSQTQGGLVETYYYDNTAGAITIENWKTDFYWAGDGDYWYSWGDHNFSWVGLLSHSYSKQDIDINTGNMGDTCKNKWVYAKNDEGNAWTSKWWGLADNPAEVGKTYSKSEFEKIAWYYCPGISHTQSYKQASYTATIPAQVWSPHVTATLQNSTDRNYSIEDLGTIKITLHHNGHNISKQFEIKVYKETRKCNKYCTK